ALRADGRDDEAEVIKFQLALSRALWRQARQAFLDAGQPAPRPGSRYWRERLTGKDGEPAKRIKQRGRYLAGRKTLLEGIQRYYRRAGPNYERNRNWLRAKAELRDLEFEQHRDRRVPGDPLAAVAELARQRESSASDAAASERRGIDTGHPDATDDRRTQQRELAAAMRLLGSAAVLTTEIQLSDPQRDWGRQRW